MNILFDDGTDIEIDDKFGVFESGRVQIEIGHDASAARIRPNKNQLRKIRDHINKLLGEE